MGKLEKGLVELGIVPSEEQLDKLNSYIGELEKWNPLYSLVHATGDDLIVRHILDSLSGLDVLRKLGQDNPSPRLADMGTGGGLPGIPLALFLEGWTVDLVERSGKRINFLNDMVITLGLSGVETFQKDLKSVKKEYDFITFRAFRPFLPEIIKGLKNCLAPGGLIGAYKGKMSSIEEEKELLKAHFNRIETIPLSVPFLKEERHLLILGDPC
jgi:16S rRNA (guanine527-N7)-methyltransferase